MKQKLWNRKLSCGHERMTGIAFVCDNYEKPKVGSWCFCRECMKDMKIIEVVEATDKKLIAELIKIGKKINEK